MFEEIKRNEKYLGHAILHDLLTCEVRLITHKKLVYAF